VDTGQLEAAQAFAMGPFLSFRRVVFPQMWRIALPGIGNLFMVLLKNTALLSVIGVQDLMRNTASAVGYTKKPFTFYLVACFLYLFLTTLSMVGIELLERRASRGIRRV
jgi:polar amino acid transport system permease protein